MSAISKAQLEALEKAARAAQDNAYSPYFNVHVGAAILGEDDQIYVGCNVENASGSAIICAEPHAIGQAVVSGVRKFKGVFVVARSQKGAMYFTPCGVCRQRLYEFSPQMKVFSGGNPGDEIRTYTLQDLLPEAFCNQSF